MPVSILPMTLEVMMKKIFPGILEKESSPVPAAIRANSSLPGTQVGRKQVHQLVCRHHAHRAIWVPADSAKWPCRSIGSICWGQPSEYGTSKQLSTLRFIGQWLRGRDKANLGWINFETENISFLGPIWPVGSMGESSYTLLQCTALSCPKSHGIFLLSSFQRHWLLYIFINSHALES